MASSQQDLQVSGDLCVVDAVRWCVLPAGGMLGMRHSQENTTSTRKQLCKVRSLPFLPVWPTPRLWNSYLLKGTELFPLLCCKWPILCLKYLLGLFRSLIGPKSAPYPKAGLFPLQYLLQVHVRASYHSVPKRKAALLGCQEHIPHPAEQKITHWKTTAFCFIN